VYSTFIRCGEVLYPTTLCDDQLRARVVPSASVFRLDADPPFDEDRAEELKIQCSHASVVARATKLESVNLRLERARLGLYLLRDAEINTQILSHVRPASVQRRFRCPNRACIFICTLLSEAAVSDLVLRARMPGCSASSHQVEGDEVQVQRNADGVKVLRKYHTLRLDDARRNCHDHMYMYEVHT